MPSSPSTHAQAYGTHSSDTPVTVHLLGKSSALNKARGVPKSVRSHSGSCALDTNVPASDYEDTFTAGYNNHQITFLKEQRYLLEKDVIRLQKQLQQEVELRHALKSAFGQAAGEFSGSVHLPIDAQELLADIAALELTVANLEDRINTVSLQLWHEQMERQIVEHRMMGSPSINLNQKERQKIQSRLSMLSVQDQVHDIHQLIDPNPMLGSSIQSSNSAGRHCNPSPTPKDVSHSTKQSCHKLQYPLSPSFCDHYSMSKESHDPPTMLDKIPNRQQVQSELLYTSNGDCSCRLQNGSITLWERGNLLSPKMNIKGPNKPSANTAFMRQTKVTVKNVWLHPCKLSQEVVNCMISIYCHLASPVDTLSSIKKFPSPNSPYGNIMSSSVSSVSESSFLSLKRSPRVDLHNKEIGDEKSFDPYRVPEKLPWADIGAYNTAIEVCEMCVGKEQLEYAAEALRTFRSLVEQLSRVDPSTMKHEEKLAFWINLYNALMMHAYLAYGVPKNDFKFFSLMQKAAYTVGGHSFNAVVIEHLLLKGKAQWYRPQIALLLAHQKLKLREEVSMFAIDRVEPLVTFSLSFGARSSPAVRIYSSENVHDELQAAFQEYACASVSITSKGKLLIPKLLHDFGRELVEESEMVEWICQLLPCGQASIVQQCVKHRHRGLLSSKQFAVIPFDFRFRYLFLVKPNE